MSMSSRRSWLLLVRKLLREYGVRPRSDLGQNFLVVPEVAHYMAEQAHLTSRDHVLEIGAGLGLLTQVLAEYAGRVTALEVDRRLVKILQHQLRTYDNVDLIHGDVLYTHLRHFRKVVSNLPFSIASEILEKLLCEWSFLEVAIVTVQREFAERLVAVPGTEQYGRLSILAKLYGEVRILRILPPHFFYPVPEVYSAIVEIRPKPRSEVPDVSPRVLSQVTALLFSERRKVLRRVLRDLSEHDEVWRQVYTLLPQELLEKRIYELTPEEVLTITKLYTGLRTESGGST